MIRPFILLLAATVAAAPAAAREITETDREAVAALALQVDAAMESGDMMAAMDVAPPALLDAMAEAAGLSPEEARAAMEEAVEEAMAEVEIVSSEIRLDEAVAGETPTGRPYLLAPSETVMQVGEDTLRSESVTLALEDEGDWYLVRIYDIDRIAVVREAYPDFAGVEFPRGRMSVVE